MAELTLANSSFLYVVRNKHFHQLQKITGKVRAPNFGEAEITAQKLSDVYPRYTAV